MHVGECLGVWSTLVAKWSGEERRLGTRKQEVLTQEE